MRLDDARWRRRRGEVSESSDENNEATRTARLFFEMARDDDDPELILRVPFTSDVKLRGFVVRGGPGGRAPSAVKIWADRAEGDIDLDNAARKTPTQRFDLAEDLTGDLEYRVDATKFGGGVSAVTMFFPANHANAGATEILFVGFRGEGTGNRRDMIVTAVYEARPMPQDHRTAAEDGAPAMLQ